MSPPRAKFNRQGVQVSVSQANDDQLVKILSVHGAQHDHDFKFIEKKQMIKYVMRLQDKFEEIGEIDQL